jgi:hypothetical protein
MSQLVKEILLKAIGDRLASAGGGALILDGIRNGTPEEIAGGIGAVLAVAALSTFRKVKRARKAKKQP